MTEKDPYLSKIARIERLNTTFNLPDAKGHYNNGIDEIITKHSTAKNRPALADTSHIIRECLAYLNSDAEGVFQTPAAYLLDLGTIQGLILLATKPRTPTDISIIDENSLREDIVSMCSELLKALPMSIGEMTSGELPEVIRKKFEGFIINELKRISPVRDMHTYLTGYFTALNKCFTAARINSELKVSKIFNDNKII